MSGFYNARQKLICVPLLVLLLKDRLLTTKAVQQSGQVVNYYCIYFLYAFKKGNLVNTGMSRLDYFKITISILYL